MDETIGWISASVALLAAFAAGWQAYEARKARTEAANSADHARGTAESLQTLANIAEAEATRVTPSWKITHSKSNIFVLYNDSREICRDVSISTEATGVRFDPWPEPVDIDGYSSKSFLFAGSSGTGLDRNLRVEWHLDRHPEPITWVGEVPRRPRD